MGGSITTQPRHRLSWCRGGEEPNMPKPNKINVLTVKLTVHIPVNLADSSTVREASECAVALLEFGKGYGQASMPEPHISRVSAPKPEASEPSPAAADDLGIPDN